MLTEICKENILVIANTLFLQHKRLLYTWTLPNGQYWNEFHHILCSWRWRSSTQLAKTIPELTVAQISSVQSISHIWLCDLMDCSTPGLPVYHQLPEFTQTHVHWVGDAIQTSHPLSSPFPLAFNHSQHQGLFKWVSFLHQMAKVLEFQLQHQSFQWIFRVDFL